MPNLQRYQLTLSLGSVCLGLIINVLSVAVFIFYAHCLTSVAYKSTVVLSWTLLIQAALLLVTLTLGSKVARRNKAFVYSFFIAVVAQVGFYGYWYKEWFETKVG